jgi:hypothetical protein
MADKDTWMVGKLVDPPSGWRFGFPRVYNPHKGETFGEWLVRVGYPLKDVDLAIRYSRVIG